MGRLLYSQDTSILKKKVKTARLRLRSPPGEPAADFPELIFPRESPNGLRASQVSESNFAQAMRTATVQPHREGRDSGGSKPLAEDWIASRILRTFAVSPYPTVKVRRIPDTIED